MDGRSRVLSDVSETELLEDEKFEDALETFTEREAAGSTTPVKRTEHLVKTASVEKKSKTGGSADKIGNSQTADQDNGMVSKSRQESIDKGKGAAGARERRFKDLKSFQTIEVTKSVKKAVWCMKFSPCGRFLATGGADCEVRVWCTKSHQYELENLPKPTETAESVVKPVSEATQGFALEPFAIFKGHKNEILDLVWSDDYNLFSCGMDKDVKLWSLSTKTCIGTLRHDASVSSAKLLPKNRNFLATITCEGYLRLWDVPHRKVAGEIKVHNNLCTALEIIEEDSIIVVGTTDGRCLFFTKTLAPTYSVLTISEKKPKIFDICSQGDKLLVTTDDSKTRMYISKTQQLLMKYNGAPHMHSLTRASFSPDSQYIISGAEDNCLYFWTTNPLVPSQKNEQKQVEKIKVGRSGLTIALFAPKPELLIKQDENSQSDVIVCVDCNGLITVMTSTSAEL